MVDHGGLRIEAFEPRAVYKLLSASSRYPRPTAKFRVPESSCVLMFSAVELRWTIGTRAACVSVRRAPFGPSPALPARWPSSVRRLPSEWSLDPSEEQAKSSGNREIMTAITAIITGVRNVPCECCAFSGSSIINAGYKSGSYPPPTVLSPVSQAPRGARGSQAEVSLAPAEVLLLAGSSQAYPDRAAKRPQQHERLVPSGGCQRGQESIQRKQRENARPHPPLRWPRSTSIRQVGEDDSGHDREDIGHAGHSDNNDVVHNPIRRLVREPYPRTHAATGSRQ